MNTIIYLSSGLGLFLAIGYTIIIYRYLQSWRESPEWQLPPAYLPTSRISILVPARNEAANIIPCIDGLLTQDLPTGQCEIIVIDDHSTDDTAQIVASRYGDRVRLIRLAQQTAIPSSGLAHKKLAIATGIQQATGTLILTTDADCIAPPTWARMMAGFHEQSGALFIAAPVNFFQEKNPLERFQSLDMLGTMLLTGAGVQTGRAHLCNGANLAYTKSVFEAVEGFSGIDHLASGDDMLLMHKVAARFPGRIGFLKNVDATVLTPAMPDLRSFIRQRLRWASKSGGYVEWRITFTLAWVFFYCWSIILSFLFIPFFGVPALLLFLGLFTIKSTGDFFLLRTAARYFHRTDLLRSFWPSQVMHILYIAGIGLLANVKKQYTWKGRKVR